MHPCIFRNLHMIHLLLPILLLMIPITILMLPIMSLTFPTIHLLLPTILHKPRPPPPCMENLFLMASHHTLLTLCLCTESRLQPQCHAPCHASICQRACTPPPSPRPRTCPATP